MKQIVEHFKELTKFKIEHKLSMAVHQHTAQSRQCFHRLSHMEILYIHIHIMAKICRFSKNLHVSQMSL